MFKRFKREGLSLNIFKKKISEVDLFAVLLCFIFLYLVILNSFSSINQFRSFADTINKPLKECALWLHENSTPGSIVLANWGFFGELFFYNPEDYYVVGYNPVDLYVYNSTMFWYYLDTLNFFTLSIGDYDNIHKILTEEMEIDYVVTRRAYENDIGDGFKLKFSNNFCSVFEVER
jgi:hypothetical protein